MATIQLEQGQEGHLSLVARWPGAKPVEEPHSLRPETAMWTGEPEQTPVSFSFTAVHTHIQYIYAINEESWRDMKFS